MKFVHDYWFQEEPCPNGWPIALYQEAEKIYEKSGGKFDQICHSLIEKYNVKFHWMGHVHHFYNKHQDTMYVKTSDIVEDDDELYICMMTIFHINVHETLSLTDLFSPLMLQHFKSGKVKIVLDYLHDPIDLFLLMNIEKSFAKNGVNPENIFFLAGNDHGTSKDSLKMNVIHEHISLYQASFNVKNQDSTYDDLTKDRLRYVSLDEFKNTGQRKHRFMSFNREPRPHRMWLLLNKIKHDLDINISYLSSEFNTEKLLAYPICPETEVVNKIKKSIPITIDVSKFFFSTRTNPVHVYLDSYINIVTETDMNQFTIFMSEKTWRPIQNFQPFISMGNMGTLRELKRLGFKTFSPWINEEYDNIPNSYDRLCYILMELLRINNMPLTEVHDMCYNMTDILIHNRNHLENNFGGNPYEKIFETIENKVNEYKK